jgi:hypothetical protein
MVVGWDVSDSLERHSVIRALRKAVRKRRPFPGFLCIATGASNSPAMIFGGNLYGMVGFRV